jgi:hypothetical protein
MPHSTSKRPRARVQFAAFRSLVNSLKIGPGEAQAGNGCAGMLPRTVFAAGASKGPATKRGREPGGPDAAAGAGDEDDLGGSSHFRSCFDARAGAAPSRC